MTSFANRRMIRPMAKNVPLADPRLDRVFAALADPSRRLMLARLAEGEATVGVVGAPLGLVPSSVSKHLAVLERAGLIARRHEGRHHWLRLEPEGFRLAAELIARYERYWGAGTDPR
jgi:DNA-binding transcriptional ArsR family regulator